MMRRHLAFFGVSFLLVASLAIGLNAGALGWSNGGYSTDPSNPKYGTHDWIAEHALDWLPAQEKQFLLDNKASYLYGTELPDNDQAPDGIGDARFTHHIYFFANGSVQDDAAAVRARDEYAKAVSAFNAGNLSQAAKLLGVVTHYISDMAVFGHVMGASTAWGTEVHHTDDYEPYVQGRTDSYEDEFNSFLVFDGNRGTISAYDAALILANDTTFDADGHLTCVWMDQNYNWSNSAFRNRAGESLNLAVNIVTDVLHTFYTEATIPEFPSWIILPFLIIATMLVVLAFGRKRKR